VGYTVFTLRALRALRGSAALRVMACGAERECVFCCRFRGERCEAMLLIAPQANRL